MLYFGASRSQSHDPIPDGGGAFLAARISTHRIHVDRSADPLAASTAATSAAVSAVHSLSVRNRLAGFGFGPVFRRFLTGFAPSAPFSASISTENTS